VPSTAVRPCFGIRKGVETSHMSLSYVDSGIILRTPAGMGSVMHSQAVTLLRFVPAALVLFALAIAGVINQAPLLTIVSGLMPVALTITPHGNNKITGLTRGSSQNWISSSRHNDTSPNPQPGIGDAVRKTCAVRQPVRCTRHRLSASASGAIAT